MMGKSNSNVASLVLFLGLLILLVLPVQARSTDNQGREFSSNNHMNNFMIDGCTFSFPQTVYNLPVTAGTGQIVYQMLGFCSHQFGEFIPWLTITTTSQSCSFTGCTYRVNFSYEANTGLARSALWYIGDRNLTINQAPVCNYLLNPANSTVGSTGGNNSFNVSVNLGCSWQTSVNVPWITTNSSGNGNGSVSYSVAANQTNVARTGLITVGGKTFTITQQALTCSYTLNPTGVTVATAGGNGSFLINAQPGCAWNASTNSNWITVNASGNGSGAINFSVAANTGATRSGIISVGGQNFTVTQSPLCNFSINPDSLNVIAAGITSSFNVTTATGCNWNSTSNVSWITANSTGSGSGGVNFTVAANTGIARTGTISVGGRIFTVTQSAPLNRRKFDFDGDGKSDISVYRPSNGIWHLQNSAAGYSSFAFGLSSDLITPADFDGDKKTDYAVFRPSTGVWYLQRSSLGFFVMQFGSAGDIPRPGDFDGDGKADIAVFRPSNGTWYKINSSNNQVAIFQFGLNGDIPLISDFNGDGKDDIAVFRPSNGTWYWINSATGLFRSLQFGTSGDIPVPADYSGDERDDIAVFRPSNGAWYIYNVADGQVTITTFGLANDIPVSADYDGDGKANISVFRPTERVWYWLKPNGGFSAQQFGISSDIPIPSSFVR